TGASSAGEGVTSAPSSSEGLTGAAGAEQDRAHWPGTWQDRACTPGSGQDLGPRMVICAIWRTGFAGIEAIRLTRARLLTVAQCGGASPRGDVPPLRFLNRAG